MMISTVRSTQNGNLIRNTRSYGTSHSTTTSQSSSSDKALMDELRRLSHRQDTTSQPMLGPFMMPREHTQEPALSGDDYRHWSQVSWPARIRRTFRLGRNLLIVSFGGCLGIMVVGSSQKKKKKKKKKNTKVGNQVMSGSFFNPVILYTIDSVLCVDV
jgi:hypothetical protein